MKSVFLVRHGEKIPNTINPGLSTVGIKQAQETGKFLQQFPISCVIASPILRTKQTAEYIAATLGLEFTLDENLVERMMFNKEKMTSQEFFSEWNKATKNRQYVPKHGDSSYATGQRMSTVIASGLQEHSHIVVVSHGGSIVDYLRSILGENSVADLKKTYDSGLVDYKMMNCAVNRLLFQEKPLLELLNYTDHLSHVSE